MLLWSFFQVQCTEWDFFSWGGGGEGFIFSMVLVC